MRGSMDACTIACPRIHCRATPEHTALCYAKMPTMFWGANESSHAFVVFCVLLWTVPGRFTGELCWAPTRFSQAEILVLAGGVISPAVPFCTRISARLKRVRHTIHP